MENESLINPLNNNQIVASIHKAYQMLKTNNLPNQQRLALINLVNCAPKSIKLEKSIKKEYQAIVSAPANQHGHSIAPLNLYDRRRTGKILNTISSSNRHAQGIK